MKNQVKVKQTEQYTDSQGTHTVCRGKLLFLPKDGAAGTRRGCFEYRRGEWMRPIIISETEEIEVNDLIIHKTGKWVAKCIKRDGFHIYHKTINGDIEGNQYASMYYKILTLPENFSPKHLQAIIDGKLKDGDEVSVECEDIGNEEWMGDDHDGEPFWNSIYCISLTNNHIKLFPFKYKNWTDVLKQYEVENKINPIYLSDWLDKNYPIKSK